MLSKSLEGTAKFHHIGIAVKDFEKSITFYEHLGYEASKPLVDSHQNVELVMLCSQVSPDIELIKPINEKSPVHNFLKINTEAIYHICYETNDLERTLQILEQTHRVICVSKPKPASLFSDRLVSFYHVRGVGIIELLEGK
ncbi:MAG: hypothetical protein A2V70_13285 [Planctomycetes bacterium RBG_13_63_9]|nr:MAG: hypothetical protein A2V70_13285 [Planctomycetes bacterium RBG_13_63_9]